MMSVRNFYQNMTEREFLQAKATDSLSFFTQYFFAQRFGREFVIGDHHRAIWKALGDVVAGHTKRLIINIPPRFGKTEVAVKNFIAFAIARNPKSRFIHLSYSASLALDNSEEIKDLIESAEYQRLFPYVKLKSDSQSKEKWYTTYGGGLYATAAGGQVTGFGAGQLDASEFSGAIIIDDPVKPDDADSATTRDRINYRFDSTIRSRVNDRNTPIIVIMQRIHQNDLSGYLIKQGGWEVLCLPALREDGTSLWPFKMDVPELEKLRTLNPFVFDTQYQQNPKPPEGLVFDAESLQYYDSVRLEDVESVIAAIDVADQGTDSLSMPVAMKVGDRYFVDEWLFTTEGIDVTPSMAAGVLNAVKANFVIVETNNQGNAFIELLRGHLSPSISVQGIYNTSNKHSRILNQSYFIKRNFLFKRAPLASQYGRAVDELTGYRRKADASGHDDAPDSLALLSAYVQDLFG